MKKITKDSILKYTTLIACILVQLCAGILYLWSIFNGKVQEYYLWSKSSANLVSSFMLFGFVLGNLGGGILRDKTNPKVTAFIGSLIFSGGMLLTSLLTKNTISLIYITYSACAGIGCGFIYGSVLGCLIRLFPTKRGLASGISVAAFATSTVIFSPLITHLLNVLTVPEVFRYLGLAFLIIMLGCCALIFLPKTDVAKVATGLNPAQAVKLPAFWLMFAFSFFINATWNILLPILKTLGTERLLSPTVIGVVIMLTGIANATGRFSAASASDKLGRGGIMVGMAVITMLCGISLIFAKQYAYLVAVIVTAFCYGGPSAVMPAMTIDLAGAKYNGTNYGILLLSLGLSSVAFTFFSNLLFDATASYTLSFVLAAASSALAAFAMLMYIRLTKKPLPSQAPISTATEATAEASNNIE